MKIYEFWNQVKNYRVPKYLIIMKISAFFILLSVMQSFANSSYSQSARISMNLNDVTVTEVFDEIENQTEFHVFYKKDHVDENKRVDINVSNSTVLEVLDKTLKGQDVEYSVMDRDILIVKSKAVAPATEVAQQSGKVTGQITDKYGETIPGVAVMIKGTTTGVVTDIDGKYSIAADANAVLVFSFVGMSSQEIVVGNQSAINVTMASDIIGLEEIVAIGYGSMKKSDLTGAVSSVRSEDIVRASPKTASEALQGQVAGVNIQKVKGRPGDGFTIDIRGISNFDDNNEGLNEPLVVIDGVMGANMNTLNPADIQSVDVLKDASSTAIYGSRGANGVIIIKTKKGVLGKPKVTYSGYAGVKMPTHLPKMMDAGTFYYTYNELRPAEVEGSKPRGWTSTEVANGENNVTTDWIDMVTDPALQTSHTVALSGGTENTVYDFSTGYLDEGGNTLHTGFNRYTIKAGMESKINDAVKVGLTSYYAYGKQNLASAEVLRSAYRSRPTGVAYYDQVLNPTESNETDWNGYAVRMGIDDSQVINPMVELDPENAQRERLTSDLMANGYLDITPVKGLSIRSSLSTAVSDMQQGEYYGTYTKTRKVSKEPMATKENMKLTSYTWDNILTYNINTGLHNVTFTGLHSVFKEVVEQSYLKVENLPFRSLWHNMATGDVTGHETTQYESTLLSYMGRLNYSFNDKYMVTVTGRYDGSSKLSEENKWAFFPSAAVAWRASEEDFIKDLGLFSNLKVRASYGEVGNASSVRPYATQARIMQTAYDFGGSSAYGFAPANLGNSDLQWERSREVNIGLNMGFMNNRISADVELYKRNTENLIVQNMIPTSKGFDGVTANVGEIMNQGIEITLNTVNIDRGDFKWKTNINFSINDNEVVELYDGLTQDIGNNRFVGESTKPIYSYEFGGIWQLGEETEAESFGQSPGGVKVIDQLTEDTDGDGVNDAADGVINADDRIIIGSQIPRWIMGIKNTFNYKQFDLSCLVYTRQGVMFENNYMKGTFGDLAGDRYNRSTEIDYWTTDNPSNTFYGLGGPGLSNHHTRGNTRRSLVAQKADFWRISDITLGYTLPKSVIERLGVGHVRLYAQAGNPFIFTDYLGFSPEYNSGVSNDDVPFSTYLFGLNVSF
jgi:TonB-linked SusC/RagA family outer membrane protein